jgi:class 3 adenylate cyclase
MPGAVGVPQTRYARSGDVHIAYQVVGDGPLDLVWIPSLAHHVELPWLQSRRECGQRVDDIVRRWAEPDAFDEMLRAAELGDAAWRTLLTSHNELVRRELGRYRGTELDTAGDGFFASFDGPARAIRCACAVVSGVRDLDLEVRAGLHTGECELVEGKVGGIAVHIGARIASLAAPGEVLVSSTVRDLVAGSGITFADRGSSELRGIPGEWRLFAAEQEAA